MPSSWHQGGGWQRWAALTGDQRRTVERARGLTAAAEQGFAAAAGLVGCASDAGPVYPYAFGAAMAQIRDLLAIVEELTPASRGGGPVTENRDPSRDHGRRPAHRRGCANLMHACIGTVQASEIVRRYKIDTFHQSENPGGYQCALQATRVQPIARYVLKGEGMLPTALLANIRSGGKFESIGDRLPSHQRHASDAKTPHDQGLSQMDLR